MKTIELDALYPFYLGYESKQSFEQGKDLLATVSCGCHGKLVPGNRFRMELCDLHATKADDGK